MIGLNVVCFFIVFIFFYNFEVYEVVCIIEFYIEYIYVNLFIDLCCVKVLICKIFGLK